MSHRTINPYKFVKLYNRQDGRCFYCLQKFTEKRTNVGSLKKATVDHIKPRCEMKWLTNLQQNTMNTVLACKECNQRKANISAELFLEWYEAINIAPYDEPSFYIAVKTRSKRHWYHRYLTWK